MLVMDVFAARFVGFSVELADIYGARFGERSITPSLPKHVSTDHDPLFRFHRWLANLRVLEIEEIKSVACVPASHPFIERLIGTVRRKYLDQVLFRNAAYPRRKPEAFRYYYNEDGVHR
jgi:putative transposase